MGDDTLELKADNYISLPVVVLVEALCEDIPNDADRELFRQFCFKYVLRSPRSLACKLMFFAH